MRNEKKIMENRVEYKDGEVVFEAGSDGMDVYFILDGKAQVSHYIAGMNQIVAILGKGEFFGEMALFERDVRSATVRPLGEVRVLTIDKKIFLRKIHEDPSLAFRIMQKMSRRIRELNGELTRLTPVTSAGD